MQPFATSTTEPRGDIGCNSLPANVVDWIKRFRVCFVGTLPPTEAPLLVCQLRFDIGVHGISKAMLVSNYDDALD
jgi:hypothetical protein